ncbi:MAG: HPP family protein [Ruminococcus sp.]|nr:HPP family protein [Ruminococcus sp.]
MITAIKKQLPLLTAVMTIGLMTGLAGWFQNSEIIFPELSAIAVGALTVPEMAWRVSKSRMLICISLCAVLGVVIVCFLPLPVEIELCIAFFTAQMIFICSGTSFAPMISAVVLPVMMQTESPVYLLSASGLTALVLLCRIILEKTGILPEMPFQPLPKPDKTAFLQALTRTFAGCLVILPAVLLDVRFLCAPPLLVAFTEFCKPDSPAERKKPGIFLLMLCCAVTGSLCRYLFTVLLSLPICIPAVLTVVLVILTMQKSGMILPPAGAISILAYLIPETLLFWYPVQISAGTLILLFLSDICRQKKTVPA